MIYPLVPPFPNSKIPCSNPKPRQNRNHPSRIPLGYNKTRSLALSMQEMRWKLWDFLWVPNLNWKNKLPARLWYKVIKLQQIYVEKFNHNFINYFILLPKTWFSLSTKVVQIQNIYKTLNSELLIFSKSLEGKKSVGLTSTPSQPLSLCSLVLQPTLPFDFHFSNLPHNSTMFKQGKPESISAQPHSVGLQRNMPRST